MITRLVLPCRRRQVHASRRLRKTGSCTTALIVFVLLATPQHQALACDALDATTACEAADGRLGDALDVVPEHLAVALGASLSESLASLSASRHCCCCGGGGG